MIDFVKTRRSCRKYSDLPVPEDKLKKVLKAGLLAPSGRSKKPWEFVVTTDSKKLELLSNCRTKGGGFFLKDAPAAIVIAADPELTDVWTEDCSIAASYMQLEAHSLGLATCWVQVRERAHDENQTAEDYIKNVMEIPENYKVQCILGLGYSNEEKEAYNDSDVVWEKVHFEKF